MLNPDEAAIELKKYLKKLKYIIENDADFTLIKTKIINKKKLDDVLCCIEVSFPEDYRAFVEKNGKRRLKSSSYHAQIHEAIKNKFLFSTNVYSVRIKDVMMAIDGLFKTIDTDIRFIYSDQSGMF